MTVSCWYCTGARSPCICTEDCGARYRTNVHTCGQAPPKVIAEWLRSTGQYTEEEIVRRTAPTTKMKGEINYAEEEATG